ncbi:peptide ABC transporter permease [Sulfolobus sp. E3]|nr:peptide ABC transporter permease [Sulfolobus sp. E3]
MIQPKNSSELIDVAWTYPPDALDPATGFCDPDQVIFNVVYQQLVEPNVSNPLQVVPGLAYNWTTTNYQNWTFYLRNNAYFSDGVKINATTVWFSFYRTILMGQGPGVNNYINLLFNSTQYEDTGFALPWGVGNAIENVTGLPTSNNANLTATILASILSHFNANNQTILKIMEYPYQAVVVKGPYEVQFNLLHPYRYFILDIAYWWGAIQDPVFIDEHGGVQANTPNSYIDEYGMPGSGPYMIKSVGSSYSTVVLVKNPNYWGNNVTGLPPELQPAHIPVVIIYYGLSHETRLEDFDNNFAQLSYVSPQYLGYLYNNYVYKQYVSFNQVFYLANEIQGCIDYIGMNTQVYPTNITALRLAIVHAINYTALLDLYEFNGTLLAREALGPIPSTYPIYYKVLNITHLSLYSYNISLALHYLNEAGYEGDFYVTLPNGTIIGNPKGNPLPTLDIYITVSRPTAILEEELQIIQEDLEKIGIPTAIKSVLPSVIDSWTNAQVSPNLAYAIYSADWPDPVFQQLLPLTDAFFGGISWNWAWVNLTILQNMYNTLPFITNQTQQLQLVAQAYKIIYNYAPYIWMPTPTLYYLVQPYVKGFVAQELAYYFYNMLYYQPITFTLVSPTTSTTTSVSTTSSTTITTPTTTLTTTTTHSSSSITLDVIIAVIVVIIVIIVGIILFLRGRR